ncbi:MAG: hypothetical protein WCT27_00770 [Patescibacteria group bacterium]|jgi:hypothetical protein
MAQGILVPVGQVFEVFPGKFGPYIGIAVDQNGFVAHEELVIRNGSAETTVKVSSIEIKRRRANVSKPGNQCAIKTAHPLPDGFEVAAGTEVLVCETIAKRAIAAQQELTDRPPKLQELEQRHRETARTFVK